MTYAQFKRLKPKYKVRIAMVIIIAFSLLVGVVVGLSALFSTIRNHLLTTKLDGFTASNVLTQAGMEDILSSLKLDDGKTLLVMDSRVVCSEEGAILEVEMNLVNLLNKGADYWNLKADAKKTVLHRTSSESQNRQSLSARKLSFQDYYPPLTRIISPKLFQYLRNTFPAGEAGRYTFTDNFDNNQNPQYSAYLEQGMSGIWVPQNGEISADLPASFMIPMHPCVPLYTSVEAVDEAKSKGKRTVLSPPEDIAIVFLAGGFFF